MKSYHTTVPHFNFQAENLDSEYKKWSLQFKIFLKASNLQSEPDDRKVSLLLHHMGPGVLDVFQSFHEDIDTVSYDTVLKKFKEYFSPKKNLAIENNKFFNCRQTTQSVVEYITLLKNLAATCEFQEKDTIIRDIFICNMNSDYGFIREKLLEQGDVELEKCVALARNLVIGRQQSRKLNESTQQEIHQVTPHCSSQPCTIQTDQEIHQVSQRAINYAQIGFSQVKTVIMLGNTVNSTHM